jgi:hypothetical protein
MNGMKKVIVVFLIGLITLTSTAVITSATPVLDGLSAKQSYSYPTNEQEPMIPELVGTSLQLVDGELVVCQMYIVHTSEMEIEIQTMEQLTGQQQWPGNAKIKATTTGHDTQGANINHNCRFDGASYWSVSPLQPSPSSYTFTQTIHGTGSRYVIVEGWITTGWTESNHIQVNVWVNFP